jgi:hypothetical protein
MKKIFNLSLFVFLIGGYSLIGQNLPMELSLSDDGRQLYTGGNISAGLYNETVIRDFYLEFDQPNFWNLLIQNYPSGADLPARLFVDDELYDSVGVRFKGQTSYFMVQNSQKKSFNITLDYLIEDQQLMGYSTLNLNNAFGDASFIREIMYLHLIRNHIPAAKGCFVNLYINGESWGLYPHIQQLNSDFIREWFFSADGTRWRADRPDGGGPPGWGDGTGALNWLGPDTASYKPHYTLKKTKKATPWDDLVLTCDVLNNTPPVNLETALNEVMDVDRTLWFLASEILFTDDDSYVYKGRMDYYLYWEVETGRMVPLEYDGNSVMALNRATTWSPFYNAQKPNYPLLHKLLAVVPIRQRYLAHMRTLLNEAFKPEITHPLIDNYANQIDSLVQADPKKLYSYSQFLNQKDQLKQFFQTRYNYFMGNNEINQTGPAISDVVFITQGGEWVPPVAGEPVVVNAMVADPAGVHLVHLYSSPGLSGKFIRVPMFDDGLHNDGEAGDGLYGAIIPGFGATTWVRFYIEGVSGNVQHTSSFLPEGAEHNVFVYRVEHLFVDEDVVVNELMASNSTTASDEWGDYDDWIELYNKGTETIDLQGYFLSDKVDNITKWSFPESTPIAPGEYKIVWADGEPEQGPLHTNFKLSAAGESVILTNPAMEILQFIEFGQQTTDMGYARVPNATGEFVIQEPTFADNNDIATYVSAPLLKGEEVIVFPNPVKDYLYFDKGICAPFTVEIFNIVGTLVIEEIITDSYTLDVSFLPRGIYLFRADGMTGKFVKSEK